MVRIDIMAKRFRSWDRRELLAGLGALAASPLLLPTAGAQTRPQLSLRAQPGLLPLRPGGPETPIWSLAGPSQDRELRFRRGDALEIGFANDLPAPMVLNWHGMDGIPASEPLLARQPLAAGGKDSFSIPLRQAGTFLCDLNLLSDGKSGSASAQALVVEESEAPAVDRDEVFVLQDWRPRPDGTAIGTGIDPAGAQPVYTINSKTSQDLKLRLRERLRLRFINSFQRTVIAIKIEQFEVRVLALDSQPCEPFPARNGAIVLAPGSRADVLIDVTAPPGPNAAILLHDGKEARPIARLVASSDPPVRGSPLPVAVPLPSNGLPERLDLRNALRVDLASGGPEAGWTQTARFAPGSGPAFRAKAGQTVVLALTNRTSTANVFHLHGHHFRVLDRLDDGWKPFWLDTLAVEAGQTQRIAFLAEHAGRWLIESFAADWTAPLLLRWYGVG